MVQLTTTYDKDLGKKTYVLKGDEAYAKTTDTVLNIIEFDDTYNHRTYMRVGLEFSVYRMIGDDSSLNIILNDEILNENPIPWVENPTAETFADFDYLTWDDERKVLIWGDNSRDSGLFLPYEYDNEFYVKFYGNKQCQKSESKHYTFNKKIPSEFDCSITFTSPSPVYPIGNIDDLTVTFTSDRTIENTKSIKIFEDERLLKTITVTKDEPYTFSINLQSREGLKNLYAVFDGDDEASPTTTQYDISHGINYVSIDAPSTRTDISEFDVVVTIHDWFGNPIVGEELCLMNGTGSGYTDVSGYVATDSDGIATLSCTRSYNDNFKIYPTSSHRYYDSRTFYITEITPEAIDCTYPSIIGGGSGGSIVAYVSSTATEPYERIEVAGIPIEFREPDRSGDYHTYTRYTDESGYATYNIKGIYANGDRSFRVRYYKNGLTRFSKSFTIEDVWQYSSKTPTETIEINKRFNNTTTVTNGYKVNSGYTTTIESNPLQIENISYEFDLVVCEEACHVSFENIGGYLIYEPCHVKVTKTYDPEDLYSNTYEVYVNGVFKHSTHITGTPHTITVTAKDGYIILNNIKVKRLPDE